MNYPEKAGLEAEKAARSAVHNEYDMLKGCINRMFLTDDMGELCGMYDAAKKGIDRIYEYHEARVRQFQSINGGGL
ncbi:MAG: hypothetical protein NC548_65970 [Lachnospiraceae bacterium]|nr:hypothetical protein [Lachnospiraceae bacterium]